ncbi:MAG: protein arginine N-methyltransferase [Pseudomonadota bacterium]
MSVFTSFMSSRQGVPRGKVYWGRRPAQPRPPIEGGKVRGWASDASGKSPVRLELVIDGTVAAKTTSSIRRDGMADPLEAQFGFALAIPASFHDGRAHDYTIRVSRSGAVLPGGRFVAVLDDAAAPVEVSGVEGATSKRLLLPWRRPASDALVDEAAGIAEAKRLVAAGDLSGAAAVLRDLYNAAPGSQAILERLAKVYASASRDAEALAALDCLIALNPSHLPALERKARILAGFGPPEAFRAALDQLAELGLDTAGPALDQLCAHCLARANYDAAVAVARRHLTLDPTHVPALEHTISALVALGRTQDLSAAVKALQEVAPTSPQIILGEAFSADRPAPGAYPIEPTVFLQTQYQDGYLLQDIFFDGSQYHHNANHACKETFEISREFVSKQGAAVDVGCRDGEYARYIQREFEHVFCFDPRFRPKTFPHNVDLRRATHFQCALGDEVGEITMYGGTHDPQSGKEHVAKCLRLDDFGLTDIAYLKIDVEGFETKVLAGAEQTIARERPLIVIEQNEVSLPGEGRYAAKEWLEARGYHHVATCRRGWDMVMQHADEGTR